MLANVRFLRILLRVINARTCVFSTRYTKSSSASTVAAFEIASVSACVTYYEPCKHLDAHDAKSINLDSTQKRLMPIERCTMTK